MRHDIPDFLWQIGTKVETLIQQHDALEHWRDHIRRWVPTEDSPTDLIKTLYSRSLDAKYALLAAIHDLCFEPDQAPRINPWPDDLPLDAAKEGITYLILKLHLLPDPARGCRGLDASASERLQTILDDVTQTLPPTPTAKPNEGDGKGGAGTARKDGVGADRRRLPDLTDSQAVALPEARNLQEFFDFVAAVCKHLDAMTGEWWYRQHPGCRSGSSIGPNGEPNYGVVDGESEAAHCRRVAARRYRDQLRTQLLHLCRRTPLNVPERDRDAERDIKDVLAPWAVQLLNAGAKTPAPDRAIGNAGSPPANLAELIAQFQSAARFYYDLAFRNGRDLPDLQNEADTFAAMNRLVEVGKALAAELEKAGSDPTELKELYRLLDAGFMRLEKGRYLAAWEPVRISLARIATVVALTPPAAKPGKGEGNGGADLLAGKLPNAKPEQGQGHIDQARNWLQSRFLAAPERAKSHDVNRVYEPGGVARSARDEEKYFLAVPREEFHAYLLSIGAPVAETIRLCQAAGWITVREGGFDIRNLQSFYAIMPAVVAASTSPSPKPNDGGTTQGKRFRVALSFPGEHRPFVVQVADVLSGQLEPCRVFYDKYYEAELARPNLDTYLQGIYHDDSDLIAVFLCAEYEKKDWCGLEWRAIRDLIKKRAGAAIMLFCFDTTTISGLFSIDGYVEVGQRSPAEVASLILERLEHNDHRDPGAR